MGEQVTGASIQSQHHRIFLDFRRQDYLVQTEIFEEVFDTAKPEEQKKFASYLTTPNPDELRHKLTEVMSGTTMTMITLKKIARLHYVPNYSRMSKFELQDALSKRGVKVC